MIFSHADNFCNFFWITKISFFNFFSALAVYSKWLHQPIKQRDELDSDRTQNEILHDNLVTLLQMCGLNVNSLRSFMVKIIFSGWQALS